MIEAIAKAFQEGGLFMYFIAMGSAFAATVILERAIQLYIRFKDPVQEDYDAILGSIRAGKVLPDLQSYIESSQVGPVAVMAERIASAIPHGPRAILDAANEARIEVGPEITNRTGYIGMLANVSTLLGLLGTIIGLIAAFAGVAAADPAKKQQMLATGISVAMNTTAYGLMVAIPCMLSHSMLVARTSSVVEGADLLEHRIMAVIGATHPDMVEEIEQIRGW